MKKWGIIGAVIMAVAVGIGYFFNFPGDSIVAIAGATFGLCVLVMGAIKDAKEKKVKTWPVFVCIILAMIAGVCCCIGGLAQNIFAEIAGATLALLAVIFGILFNKKK